MTHRILLSGGGTAGSVTPLLALASEMHRRRVDLEFLFIGTLHGPERQLVEAANIPFQTINSGKLRRYWSWKNVSDVWNIWRGYRQAKKIICDWQPQVAVTAGSYVSVPIIKAAQQQGVKTLVHQQDVQSGLANTLMASKADVITTAFEISRSTFPKNKTFWIGNPVRTEMLRGDVKRARNFFELNEKFPVLLVLGGGTGSEKINAMLAEVCDQLTPKWQIIHLTGQSRINSIVARTNYKPYEFLTEEMADALAVADVVVTRAGLGIISELSANSKPAIIIPMPDTHQEKNAQLISDNAAGVVIHQDEDFAKKLLAALEKLRQDPDAAKVLGVNLNKLSKPDALARLADYVIGLLPS